MIHSNKDRYSNQLYQRRDDNFSVAGDGRYGVGPRTTHFSSQKVPFGIDRQDSFFGLIFILQHPP